MEEVKKKALGLNIKTRREELGLSQTELAKSVGKSSPAYIAFIEGGERNISAVDLMRLAKELGTTVSELIGESTNNKKTPFLEALRSNTELDKKDREKVEDFYLFIKKQRKNGRS